MISKAALSTIFESLVWLDLGLNAGLPDHWRTLYSFGQCIYTYTFSLQYSDLNIIKGFASAYSWRGVTRDLASLFNGISTFVGYLMPKTWYYLTHSWEDKGIYTFPKGICPKVNVIVRLEFELAYNDSTIHRFNHYTTRTPPVTRGVMAGLRHCRTRVRTSVAQLCSLSN